MKEYICKICDKQYSSIQSLCNHNKRFHNITKTTNSIHFYDSIVVFEKKIMIPPSSKMMGKWSFENDIKKKTFSEKLKLHLLIRVNKMLQLLKLKGFCINEMISLSSKK